MDVEAVDITTDEIEKIFDARYNGNKNGITNSIIRYGRLKDNLVYELATGQFFNFPRVWGVTVLDSVEHTSELSQCFDSRAAAEEFIKQHGGK